MTAGVAVALGEELDAFYRALNEPIRVLNPELVEQRLAMGIAV